MKALKRSLGQGDGVWLNRFWTVRRPSAEVLSRITEEVGDDMTLFGDDPRAVIAVVRMLSSGRNFRTAEHIRVDREQVADLVRQASSDRS